MKRYKLRFEFALFVATTVLVTYGFSLAAPNPTGSAPLAGQDTAAPVRTELGSAVEEAAALEAEASASDVLRQAADARERGNPSAAVLTPPPVTQEKFVTAAIVAATAGQVDLARAAGVAGITEPGKSVTAEIPADQVKALRAQGLQVDVIEEFLKIEIEMGGDETGPSVAGVAPVAEREMVEREVEGTSSGAEVVTVRSRTDSLRGFSDTLLIQTATSVDGSVVEILNSIGQVHDFIQTSDFTGLILSGYSTIIVAMDGGDVSHASLEHLAASISAGAKLILLGGTSLQPFAQGLNDYFIQIDMSNHSWSTVAGAPDLQVTDPGHPLATGLPATYNLVNNSASYYMARITDAGAAIVAENGDGHPALVAKQIGAGSLVYFVNSPSDSYWGDPGDYSILRTILINALAYGSVCNNSQFRQNVANQDIPDDPDTCNSEVGGFTFVSVNIDSGQFAGKRVCKMDYRLRIDHTYPGDIVAQVNNSHRSLGQGFTVWNRLGGTDDGGFDDDTPTDENIYLNRETTFFNGDYMWGNWYLDVWDHCPSDTGFIYYIEYRIYYEDPGDIRVSPTSLSFNCSAAQNAEAASAVALTPAEKLTDADAIGKPFREGQATSHVIVSLVEPTQMRAAVNWDDAQSVATLQAEVGKRQNAALSRLAADEFTVEYQFENQAGFSGHVSEEGLRKLLEDPMVVAVEPVFMLHQHTNQGIPLENALATRPTYNGSGMAIAICDTGIDYTHPRLGGGGFPNTKVIGGRDVGDNDADPMPNGNAAHGTACAGIAAGNLGTVGQYIGGVAYNAKLYAVKISYGSSGSATTAAMVAGWDWSVSHKNDDPANPIMVISTSFGGGRYSATCDGDTPAMTTAANNANAAGITVLASSGNDGYCDSMGWPACITSVISVGAVYDAAFGVNQPCVKSASCATKIFTSGGCWPYSQYYVDDNTAADKVTAYSNTATFLDLLGPAEEAYTLDIAGASGYSTGDYVTDFGGTSSACPYAAGAVAALQSAAMARTGSFLSPATVRSTLISTGDMIADTKVAITKPRVNLGAAIHTLQDPCGGDFFTVHNDGGTLTVNSISGIPAWATVSPRSFTVPANSSRQVCVEINCAACDGQDLSALLSVNSSDPDQPIVRVSISIDCPEIPGACCAPIGCSDVGECGLFSWCEGRFDCYCFADPSGAPTCSTGNQLCFFLTPCPNGNSDCSTGETCAVNTCCDEPVCVRDCGRVPSASDAEAGADFEVPEGEAGWKTADGMAGETLRGVGAPGCAAQTQTNCELRGGTFRGENTTCAATECPDCDSVFTHTVVDPLANYTIINHPLTNGDPSAILMVTQNWNPAGGIGVYNDSPIGVWYKASPDAKWTIFNEDQSAMPMGASFNVEVLPPSDSAFRHIAAAGNISGHITTIDHPMTNNNSGAILLVTQRLGAYNPDNPVGVYYSGGKWQIFNENFAAMPVGAQFNVEVMPPGGSAFIQIATNVLGNYTTIDHPLTDGNPSAIVEVTQNRTAGGGIYLDSPVAVWYSDYWNQWAIFTEDTLVSMPVGAGFNVKVASECEGIGAPEACCLSDGTCRDVPSDICQAIAGTPWGLNTTCEGTTCPGPAGACCAPHACEEGFKCGSEVPPQWCDGSFYCVCATTASDEIQCFDQYADCGDPCPDGNCPDGSVCVVNTCCGDGGPVCLVAGCPYGGEGAARPVDPDAARAFGEPVSYLTPAELRGVTGCVEVEQFVCESGGGLYDGDNTFCEGINCPDCDVDADCDDGKFCNGVEKCAQGSCLAGTPPNCADNVPCTNDTCDEVNDRCVHTPIHSQCDNGQFCDGRETCNTASGCQPGAAPSCTDNIPCTNDTCDEVNDVCVSTPMDSRCNNEQYCDGKETCDPEGGCQPGTPVDCADTVPCTDDKCDEANDRCVNTPLNSKCDNGQFCDGAEWCDVADGCQPGTAPNCADTVSCTNDTCDEANDRCVHTPVNGKCDNGQFCDGTETCDVATGCLPGSYPCTNPALPVCLEPTDECVAPGQACCYTGGMCYDMSIVECHATGGFPKGPGSVCQGDGNSNGIDDACDPTPQCEDCGPGAHWIHSPLCPPGTDNLPSGATVGIDLTLDCGVETSLRLHGPATIARSGPRDDSARFPGTRPEDEHLDVIDTEIISMVLTTADGLTMKAGAGAGAIPLAPTYGVIAERGDNAALADSFFEVFFELDAGGGLLLYNRTPLRVESVIDCVPPDTDYIHPTGCVELYTSPIPGQGEHVANLVAANHSTYLECGSDNAGDCMNVNGTPYCDDGECCKRVCEAEPDCCGVTWDRTCVELAWEICPLSPEACCLAAGACANLSPAECRRQGGDPKGPGSACEGDANGNGVDDACDPNNACDECGPGAHWMHTAPWCPPGADNLPSGAKVGIDLTMDCIEDSSLRLHGPATIVRSGPRDDSARYIGTRPLDTHMDVIDTEMVSMTLTSLDGTMTMRAGAGAGAIPLLPTYGVIAEKPTDATRADSFFDVYFEIDTGGGALYYNQTPLRVESEIDCLPPDTDYIHSTGCMALYTSPYPGTGQHVGYLVAADHSTFVVECGSDNAGDCYDVNGTPYCDDQVCCELVCGVEPDCCGVDWYRTCVEIAWDVCPQELEACCLAAGACADLSPAECRRQGGDPKGPGSACQGDASGNGVDDACDPNDACDECGPGDHWMHTLPWCPPGADNLPSGAKVGIDLDLDCIEDSSLRLHGPATIVRSGPRDDSVYYPGTRPVDQHMDVIDTEMVALTLTTLDGSATMRAGAGAGAIPLLPTRGLIAERANPALADSFFDVLFELETGDGMLLYNRTPLRVESVIDCIPPDTNYIHPAGCIALYTSPYPGAGQHVANLVTADHSTFAEADFDYQCVIVESPSSTDRASTLPASIPAVFPGSTFYVEYWASDVGATNTGIVSAYTDLDYPETCTTAGPITNTALFSLFPSGTDTGALIDELGGSQLAGGVGVEPEWARIAYVEHTADAVCTPAVFQLGPATSESSAFNRGLVATTEITYGSCRVAIPAGCCCVYDLDNNCNIAGGDLGFWAACWGCSIGNPCWAANNCGEKDFDCNGNVAGGDLGWFAGGWQRSCDQVDPVTEYPPCKQCEGPVICPWPVGNVCPGGGPDPGQQASRAVDSGSSVEVALRLTPARTAVSERTGITQPRPGVVRAGSSLFAEVWVRDSDPASTGLTAVFTDLSYSPRQFKVVGVEPGQIFTLFADPVVDHEAGVVRRAGGATLDAHHGAGKWARVTTVELRALIDVREPRVTLRASDGESVSRRGKGLVPAGSINVIGQTRDAKDRSGVSRTSVAEPK